ncbi:MAG: class I SAM-dependent methyltransferase [Oscillospiraceae bacterium]|nr:class I SAM-dependent methyltransferase [Oscillospiraceae bacterium]
MWISDRWKEYELLDCGGGERLERWGTHILVRPDPQAIWDTPREHPLWQRPDARYARSSSGGGRWEKRLLPDRWTIRYGDLRFQVGPMNFKHTGLFPEQAVNWEFAMERIRAAGRPVRVLNLFSYTGGATAACASAGAAVCHVDAARGMVSWAKENLKLSSLEKAPVRYIVDDCVKFVEREIRRGRRYDALILDPPSYGRGPSGEVWKLEQKLYPLLELCLEALSRRPLFILLNSYTSGLAPSALGYLLGALAVPRFGGRVECGEVGLPVTQTGLILPCGAAGRWIAGEG